MEPAIKILIYIHAFFGGIGLITGIGSIVVKKGGKLHKRMGKLFSVGMITSSLISIPICWMPNHQNIFLFLIGLFTLYLVVAGNRALTFKTKTKADALDFIISGSMLFFSIMMISIGLYCQLMHIANGILFTFFGGFGLYMTVKDFIFYKNGSEIKERMALQTHRKNEWGFNRFHHRFYSSRYRTGKCNRLDDAFHPRNTLHHLLE